MTNNITSNNITILEPSWEVAVMQAVSYAKDGYIIDPKEAPFQMGFQYCIYMVKEVEESVSKPKAKK